MPTLCAVHGFWNNATIDSHKGFLMISKIMKNNDPNKKAEKQSSKKIQLWLAVIKHYESRDIWAEEEITRHWSL